jgi:hypothetical protein
VAPLCRCRCCASSLTRVAYSVRAVCCRLHCAQCLCAMSLPRATALSASHLLFVAFALSFPATGRPAVAEEWRAGDAELLSRREGTGREALRGTRIDPGLAHLFVCWKSILIECVAMLANWAMPRAADTPADVRASTFAGGGPLVHAQLQPEPVRCLLSRHLPALLVLGPWRSCVSCQRVLAPLHRAWP